MNASRIDPHGLYRAKSIVRPRKGGQSQPPLIDVSPATWWAGVKAGRFPKPIKIGRCTMWRGSDLLALTSPQEEEAA